MSCVNYHNIVQHSIFVLAYTIIMISPVLPSLIHTCTHTYPHSHTLSVFHSHAFSLIHSSPLPPSLPLSSLPISPVLSKSDRVTGLDDDEVVKEEKDEDEFSELQVEDSSSYLDQLDSEVSHLVRLYTYTRV